MALWDEFLRQDILKQRIWEWEHDEFRESNWGELVQAGRRAAAGLRRLGVTPGSNVAAVITNGHYAVAGFMGAWFAGARVASLPIIARGMTIDAYVAQLRQLCASIDAEFLLAEERFLALMPDADIGVPLVGYSGLVNGTDAGDITPPPLDDTIFIQFSSGTTGEPRGVELSGHAVEAQLRLLADHLRIDPERDVGGMWIPLSHDMGFFGCWLLGWYMGLRGYRATPERFLQNPRSWFDDCAEFGVTITAGPPFAVGVAARTEQLRSSGTPLSVRLCLVGAEQIEWNTLAHAAEVFAPRGLTISDFTAAYGLAEATLAVTIGDPDAPPGFVDVHGPKLLEGGFEIVDESDPDRRRLVSCGKTLPGIAVETNEVTGEIVIESPSLASGYFRAPALTEDRFANGRFRTGDLGFMHDEELYLLGRTDDVLIVGGRNVHVQELETALGSQEGVRPGNCAIVDTYGGNGSSIAVVAELRDNEMNTSELAVRLRRISMETRGLPVSEFLFLPRGLFPKTPSGKVQRHRCRALLADGTLGERVKLGRPDLV